MSITPGIENAPTRHHTSKHFEKHIKDFLKKHGSFAVDEIKEAVGFAYAEVAGVSHHHQSDGRGQKKFSLEEYREFGETLIHTATAQLSCWKDLKSALRDLSKERHIRFGGPLDLGTVYREWKHTRSAHESLDEALVDYKLWAAQHKYPSQDSHVLEEFDKRQQKLVDCIGEFSVINNKVTSDIVALELTISLEAQALDEIKKHSSSGLMEFAKRLDEITDRAMQAGLQPHEPISTAAITTAQAFKPWIKKAIRDVYIETEALKLARKSGTFGALDIKEGQVQELTLENQRSWANAAIESVTVPLRELPGNIGGDISAAVKSAVDLFFKAREDDLAQALQKRSGQEEEENQEKPDAIAAKVHQAMSTIFAGGEESLTAMIKTEFDNLLSGKADTFSKVFKKGVEEALLGMEEAAKKNFHMISVLKGGDPGEVITQVIHPALDLLAQSLGRHIPMTEEYFDKGSLARDIEKFTKALEPNKIASAGSEMVKQTLDTLPLPEETADGREIVQHVTQIIRKEGLDPSIVVRVKSDDSEDGVEIGKVVFKTLTSGTKMGWVFSKIQAGADMDERKLQNAENRPLATNKGIPIASYKNYLVRSAEKENVWFAECRVRDLWGLVELIRGEDGKLAAGDFHPQHIDFNISSEHQRRWLKRKVVWPAQSMGDSQEKAEGYVEYSDDGSETFVAGKFFRITHMVGTPFLFIPGETGDGGTYNGDEEWLPTFALTAPAPSGDPMMFGAFHAFMDKLSSRPAYFDSDYGVPWGYSKG